VMADVARLAGVSHQTVSRVINGQSNLRPATRLRVEEAIRQLGILKQSDKLWQLYQQGIAKPTILESMFLLHDPTRLLEIARSEKDPKLRGAAIHSLGLMRSATSSDGLVSLYGTETDPSVKKKITEALFMQQNAKAMVEIARKETNPEMKRDIVQKLTMMRSKEATDYMMELLK